MARHPGRPLRVVVALCGWLGCAGAGPVFAVDQQVATRSGAEETAAAGILERIVIGFETLAAGWRADEPAARIADAEAPVVRHVPDNLFGIAFGPGGEAVATGYHGTVLVSGNGGSAWTRTDAGTSDLLRRVQVLGDGALVAVSSSGKILLRDPAGASWTVVHEEQGIYLRDVAFASDRSGWAAGHDGLILHTTDRGATWQAQEIRDWPGRDRPRLSGIAAIDVARAVVVGEFGAIAQTRDGGITWVLVSNGEFPTLLDVSCGSGECLAVGLNGALVRIAFAADGSARAESIGNALKEHLFAIALSPDGREAVIGGNGFMARLADGEVTRLPMPDDPSLAYAFIGGVEIAATGTTIAVGKHGVILRASTPAGPYERVDGLSLAAGAPASEAR